MLPRLRFFLDHHEDSVVVPTVVRAICRLIVVLPRLRLFFDCREDSVVVPTIVRTTSRLTVVLTPWLCLGLAQDVAKISLLQRSVRLHRWLKFDLVLKGPTR